MKRRRIKSRLIILAVFVAVILLVVLFLRNITNLILSIGEATIRQTASIAVTDAVYYTLGGGIKYDEIVTIDYDAEGNVSTITTDSLKINKIARDTAYLSQRNLNRMCEEGIEVPLGAFTGIEALAGFGKKINIKLIPISNVGCRFVSEFEEAGINQTKHSLYLEVVSDISIVMPQRTSQFAVTSEVLICESIINGEIPDVYLQSSVAGGSLVPRT